MTALSNSLLASAQTTVSPKPGANTNPQAGGAVKSFAELLEGSLFAKALPEKVGTKAIAASVDKDEKKKTTSPAQEPSAASILMAQVPAPHSEPDTRAWSLAIPKKQQVQPEAEKVEVTGPETAAASISESSPVAPTKQQIAFEAKTLSKAELQSKEVTQASAATESKPPQGVTPAQLVEQKSSQAKQQHSGSSNSGRDDSANKAHAAKSAPVTNSAGSVPQQQFHVPTGTSTSNASVPAPEAGSVDTRPVAKTIAAAPVLPSAEIKEPDATAAVRTPTIHLQAGEVNVRVSQRAGDVQITVRTADNDMAQSLRQHLPELADRLTQSGVHADLWEPSGTQITTSNNGTDSQSNHNSDGQTDSQGQQQSGTPEDRQNRQQRQQDWQQEFSAAGTTDR